MSQFDFGSWLVLCDRCGFRRKAPQDVVRTWDGLIVCAPHTGKECFETRHPQEFVRPVKDNPSVPYTRPEPADVFTTDVSFNCDTVEMTALFPTPIVVDTIVTKRYHYGTLEIQGDAVVTVVCTLEIR